MSVKVIYTRNNITITHEDDTRTFSLDHPEFEKYVAMWKDRLFDQLVESIFRNKKVVEKAFKDKGYTVKDGVVFINNRPVVDSIGKRIINYAEENTSPERLIRFWDRLKKNPSYWCVQSLFDFLDRNNCPIGEDGRFMAFKCVRSDFKDKHTAKIDNTPGVKIPRFNRNEVDDDKLKDCSFGYHVGSVNYFNTFADPGDKFVEVLVDPEDVISIPSDVSIGKMRVCFYEVVREIKREDVDYEKHSGVYNSPNSDLENEDDWDNVCDECGEFVSGCTCDDDDSYWEEDMCDDCQKSYSNCIC